MKIKSGSKVLFDTNIVMDLATQRSGWQYSFVAYDVAVVLGCQPVFSVSATTDVAYLLLSSAYRLDKAQATQQLENLRRMFDLIDVQPEDAHEALNSAMLDYEDALLAYAALRNECELIVTRNVKDFKDSPVLAMSPKEFVDAFKPAEYDYAEIGFDEADAC